MRMKMWRFLIFLCFPCFSPQFRMMEAAYCHLPTPSDSDKPRPYNLLQRQPMPTPPHYPQVRRRDLKLMG